MRRRAGDEGFALLEALVALAVFAAMTGMFVEVVHSSTSARREAAQRRAALMVAQSRLAQAQETGAADPSGSDGEFRWRTEVSRTAGVQSGPGLELVTVTVAERARNRTLVTLKTLRLAR